jgi:hypothetical protein
MNPIKLKLKKIYIKNKVGPVADCGGLQGSETLKIPHFQDKQLKDGG